MFWQKLVSKPSNPYQNRVIRIGTSADHFKQPYSLVDCFKKVETCRH